MKKNNKALVFLILALLALSSLSYANVQFTDIADHWAYDYIEFTAEKGIINGFPDGSFLPSNPVTKEQSLTMIYRSLAAAGILQSIDDFTDAYIESMNTYGIAEWARPYVAYALKYDIIEEKDLVSFVSNETGLPASRQEVAVWAAKAVDKKTSPIYSLPYSDKEIIEDKALPYIDLMYRHQIMIGDDYNEFRPDSTITRAEFAAVCSRVYYLGSSREVDLEKEGKTFNGIIREIRGNALYFEDSSGTLQTLIISEEAGIIINGKEDTPRDIKDNTEAVIAYNNAVDNEQLLIWTEEDLYEGTISEIRQITEDTYKITIERRRREEISYILDDKSEIYDEKNNIISMISLTLNTEVEYTCDGIKIIEMKILN